MTVGHSDPVTTRLYRRLLRWLLPAAFLSGNEGALLSVFEQLRERARSQGGVLGEWAYAVRELLGLIRLAFTVRHESAETLATASAASPDFNTEWTMQGLKRDFKYAMRTLLRDPLYVIIASVTLALGIGGTAAMLGVLEAVVINPLPYPESARLVRVRELKTGEEPWASASVPNFLDWKSRSHSFSRLALVRAEQSVNLTGDEEPVRVQAAQVTSEMFAMLGVKPVIGRLFIADDFEAGAEPRLLLSETLWRSRFAGDSAIIGRAMELNGRKLVVVGVVPAHVQFPDRQTVLWSPLSIVPGSGFATPNGRWARLFRAYGQLAPGVSLAQAQAEMTSIGKSMETEFAGPNSNMNVSLTDLREFVVGEAARAVWIMFGAAALVLLIAWVNVTNLTVARLSARTREVAVRIAYGAGWGDLVQQFACESAIVVSIGTLSGVGLAAAGLHFVALYGPQTVPRLGDVGLNTTVLASAVALSFALALTLGAVPVWLSSRATFGAGLGGAGKHTGGRAQQRSRSVLVVTEIAMAVVLLICATLLMTSYSRLTAVRTGFSSDSVLTMLLSPRGAAYRSSGAVPRLYSEVMTRVQAVPGVASVGAIDGAPLIGRGIGWTFLIEGAPTLQAGSEPGAQTHGITGSYFSTMGIPLRAGRLLAATDTFPASENVVVNEAFVRKHFAGRSPLGARIGLGSVAQTQPWMTIVGVVGDVRGAGLSAQPDEEIYRYLSDNLGTSDMTLMVRIVGNAQAVMPAIRAAIRDVDKNLPLSSVQSMETVVTGSVSRERFNSALVGVYAALALIMATVGIFGILTQSVMQQMRAMAIRIALGAGANQVVTTVFRHGMLLTLIGVSIGVAIALGLTRFMSALLFGVSATDPLVIGAVAAIFFAVAAVACLRPALFATRADPMTVLRAE